MTPKEQFAFNIQECIAEIRGTRDDKEKGPPKSIEEQIEICETWGVKYSTAKLIMR